MAGKDTAPQNFRDAIQEVIQSLARAMAAPDADLRFCQSLMMVLAGKIQQGHQASASAGVGGAGGAGAGGLGGPAGPGSAPPGGPGGMPGMGMGNGQKPPGLQMPGGPAGGGAANSMMPNLSAPNQQMPGLSPGLSPTPDELRRVISQSTG